MFKLRPAVRPASLLTKRFFTPLVRFQSTVPSAESAKMPPTSKSTQSEQVDIDPADYVPESYPEVEKELYYKRDPYAKYDDQQNRRNFGQPLHEEDDVLNLWSPEYFQFVDDKTAVKWFCLFFLTVGSYGFAMSYRDPHRISVPRSYPHDGLSKALGAKNEEEAEIYGARVDKTAL